MDSKAQRGTFEVGRWTFEPAGKSLTDATGTTVHLEDKVAQLLALFCNRAGDIISRDEIVAAVWDGRAVSEQTVPVAVSKLRKALEDGVDGAKPLLVTVPKRGYRLALTAEAVPEEETPSFLRRFLWLTAAAAAIMMAVAGFWDKNGPLSGPAAIASKPGIILTVKDIRAPGGGDAGTERAIALSELGAYFLARVPEILVIRHWWNFDAPDPTGGIYTRYGKDTPVYLLKGTLINEDGIDVVVMTLSVPMTEEVLWSGRLAADAPSQVYFRLLGQMLTKIGVPDNGADSAAAVPLTPAQAYWNGRYDTELSNPRAAVRAATRLKALLEADPLNVMARNALVALDARWPDLDIGLGLDIEPVKGDQYALIDEAVVRLYRDGDATRASQLLEAALAIAPGDHYALSLLAEAKVKTGDMAGALTAYGLAIRLAPYARSYGDRLAAIEASEAH